MVTRNGVQQVWKIDVSAVMPNTIVNNYDFQTSNI